LGIFDPAQTTENAKQVLFHRVTAPMFMALLFVRSNGVGGVGGIRGTFRVNGRAGDASKGAKGAKGADNADDEDDEDDEDDIYDDNDDDGTLKAYSEASLDSMRAHLLELATRVRDMLHEKTTLTKSGEVAKVIALTAIRALSQPPPCPCLRQRRILFVHNI